MRTQPAYRGVPLTRARVCPSLRPSLRAKCALGALLGGEVRHEDPGFGVENSSITDFDGAIGFADVQGTGTGTDRLTGQSETLLFDSDMRFMRGVYVGQDGGVRRGTFAFV